jgi:hypothetical protein
MHASAARARPTTYLEAIALARLILPPDVHLQAPPNLSDDFGVAARRRHRRLGRRLAGHRRPREPRTALAGPRPPPSRHRGAGSSWRPASRSTPSSPPPRSAGSHEDLRFPVLDRSDAEGLGRDDPGAVHPQTVGRSAPPAGRRRGRAGRAALDDSGTRHSTPTAAATSARTRSEAPATGAVAEVLDGVRAGEQSPARTRSPPCSRPAAPRWLAVAELADELRRRDGRRRRHLGVEPQHQLHERVHLQVQVLRLLEGPAVPQPARHAVPADPRRHRPARPRGVGHGRHRGLPAGRHPPRLRRRLLPRRHPGREGRRARHARARLHRARGHRGREAQRRAARRLPAPPDGRRAPPRCPAPPRRSSTTRSGQDPVLDKVDTQEWLDAHRTAHQVGLRSNVTIMFGSIERPGAGRATWCAPATSRPRPAASPSSCRCRSCTWPRRSTSSKRARRGPTFREVVLMHAVGRIAYHGFIDNIQASWVKLGVGGRAAAAGRPASTTWAAPSTRTSRAAGASHENISRWSSAAGRTTLYGHGLQRPRSCPRP